MSAIRPDFRDFKLYGIRDIWFAPLAAAPPSTEFSIWEGAVPPAPNLQRAYDNPVTLATVIDLGATATAKALRYYLHSNLTTPQDQQRPVKMAIFADGAPTPLVVVDTTPIPESEITQTEGRWVSVSIPPLELAPGRYSIAGHYFVTDGTSDWSRYAAVPGYFAEGSYQPIVKGPITVPAASTTGGNGRFEYGAALAYPASTYNGGCYFIDVLVSTAAEPEPEPEPPLPIPAHEKLRGAKATPQEVQYKVQVQVAGGPKAVVVEDSLPKIQVEIPGSLQAKEL